jgi:hypothetical protein
VRKLKTTLYPVLIASTGALAAIGGYLTTR